MPPRLRPQLQRTLPVLLLGILLPLSTTAQSRDQKVMPSFSQLPPPLIYFKEGDNVKLVCAARPRTAQVDIVARRAADTNFQSLTIARNASAEHVIRNPSTYLEMDIHCRVETDSLGVVLSRPVRLVKAMVMSSSGGRFTTTMSFMKGNVAQVLCNVPQSQPPPKVEFLKDNNLVTELPQKQKDKYKVVQMPEKNKVVLLIRDFSKSDEGIYSCRATNTFTRQSVDASRRTKLTMISPRDFTNAQLHVDDHFLKYSKVQVMEGENVTVYCLATGAPIPHIMWYRHSSLKPVPPTAIADQKFGTLELINVKTEDASIYMCSVRQNQDIKTRPVKIVVIPRLKITDAPRDVKVNRLGRSAKFTCTVTGGDPKSPVAPEWYHDGKFIDPRNTLTGLQVQNGSLTIQSVTKDLLGVYQCVARSKTEWDSASAALAQSTDQIITGEERDKQLKAAEKAAKAKRNKKKRKKNPRKRKPKPEPTYPKRVDENGSFDKRYRDTRIGNGNGLYPNRNDRRNDRRKVFPGLSNQASVQSVLSQPSVKIIYDNMAVEMRWTYKGDNTPQLFKFQYQKRHSKDGDYMADKWSRHTVLTIDRQAGPKDRFMVIIKPLEPGYVFRFRVVAVYTTGLSVESKWSKETDFSHVIPEAPNIYKVAPIGTEALRVFWSYDPSQTSPRLDLFRILVRRLLDKDKQRYDRYTWYEISSTQREYVVTRLRPGSNYQILIYGVVKQTNRNPRQITRFSSPVSKATETAAETQVPQPKHSTTESTKMMFWILGGLAGVMLVVMAVLVGMCLLRQRREKKRSRAEHHAQLNGTALDSYKDPAKMMHRRQQNQAQMHANSQFLLAQLGGAGGPNHTGTWSGPQHHLRGSSASVQQLHHVPGSAMNLNVVPETQSLMMDHYHQQHNHHQQTAPHAMNHGDVTTDLGGYGPPPLPTNMYPHHGPNGTLGSKSQLSGITSPHHHPEHDMMGDMGYPMHTGSVGPYRPLGSGYAPFMTSGQRPSHLDVRPTPAGDAESIYSYFSQQEMGVQHCGLNDVPGGPPIPYRPQLAEAGSQTTDRQQHRHHRRRRRKQAPGGIPPTGPGGPLPTAMEHSVAPSPPMMRDMAVNTDVGSTEGTYDQPASGGHLPYGYPPHSMMAPTSVGGGVGNHGMGQYVPADSSGGATASSAASSTAAYQSVTPPARMASLGQHHGYHPPPQHLQHPGLAQQPQQVDMGPAGPADASTLTRRGTPTLFVDPPKMRDYSEYAIPETKA